MEAVVNKLREIKQGANRTNELMEQQTKSLQSLEKFMERQVAYEGQKCNCMKLHWKYMRVSLMNFRVHWQKRKEQWREATNK